MNWENKSAKEITNELSQIAVEIGYNHLETTNQLKEKIKANNPTLTDKDVDKEFVIMLTELLFEKCDTYIQLIKNFTNLCPEGNKTLDIIVERTDAIMEKNQDLSYPEQIKLAEKQIFNIIKDNEVQVNKDYKDGLANSKLIDDIATYLLYKSNKYYKAHFILKSIEILN